MGEIPKEYARETVGWLPGCDCEQAETVPGMVLDPFSGSGTSLLVADRLGRRGVGVELNPAYAAASRARLERAARLRGPVLAGGRLAYQQGTLEGGSG